MTICHQGPKLDPLLRVSKVFPAIFRNRGWRMLFTCHNKTWGNNRLELDCFDGSGQSELTKIGPRWIGSRSYLPVHQSIPRHSINFPIISPPSPTKKLYAFYQYHL
jgi:hypothetical protein